MLQVSKRFAFSHMTFLSLKQFLNLLLQDESQCHSLSDQTIKTSLKFCRINSMLCSFFILMFLFYNYWNWVTIYTTGQSIEKYSTVFLFVVSIISARCYTHCYCISAYQIHPAIMLGNLNKIQSNRLIL